MNFDALVALFHEWWQRITMAIAGIGAVLLAAKKVWGFTRAAEPFIAAAPRLAEIPKKLDAMALQLGTLAMQAMLTDRTLSAFIDSEGVGLWFSDHDGRCLGINAQLTEWMGLPDAQAINAGWISGIHPDDRERVRDAWARAIRDHAPFMDRYRYLNSKTQVVTECDVTARWVSGTGVDKSVLVGMARKVPPVTPRSVLVIEDHEGTARVIDRHLERLGASMAHSATLDSGMRKLSAGKFDLVILDLSLPDSATSETLDKLGTIRDAAGTVPVAIVTGQMDRAHIDAHLLRAKVDAVAMKHELFADHHSFSTFFKQVLRENWKSASVAQ